MTRRFLAILVLTAAGCQSTGQTPADEHRLRIFSALSSQEYFSFLRYDLNTIESSSASLKPFYQALSRAGERQVRIIHIGDSHVHADAFTGVVRQRLQEMFGDSGRGLVFPYAAVKTHAARDYSTSIGGAWTSNQSIFPPNGLPIGVQGVVAQTVVPASSFTISFYEDGPDLHSPLVKIYCEKDTRSFDVELLTNAGEKDLRDCAAGLPGAPVVFALQRPYKRLAFRAVKQRKDQAFFRLYGMSLENGQPGVLYHAAGLNGARFSDFAHRQALAPLMIKEMEPDLVVFDLGINEVYTFRDNPSQFEKDVRAAVLSVRRERPAQPIVLVNLPEIYVGSVQLGLSEKYTATLRRIAAETDCGFYDTYGIGGGAGSMLNWARSGLARNDYNHLTWKGYAVKGDLFVTALLKGYLRESEN